MTIVQRRRTLNLDKIINFKLLIYRLELINNVVLLIKKLIMYL